MAARGYTSSRRTVHEIERGSNLDLLLRGVHGIGNRLVDALNGIGAGLQAIALALSTPQDNSQQVQQQIDEFTRDMRESRKVVETAIKQDSERNN
jgi:hypothetical protein